MSNCGLFLLCALLMSITIHPITCRTTKSLNGRKVVLMSMDGFRYDYLTKADTPNFDALIASGVKVPYVNNTFATWTFPCHYTIVTGLYEESHGIVANRMYDPVFNETFGKTNLESRWWNGAEPIWINAVKSGLKTGVFFWPGSGVELEGYRPTKWRPYDKKVPFEDRVDTMVSQWLSKEDFDFGLIYFHEPDMTGHMHGPDSQQMVETIKKMDGVLGYFLQKLKKEHLQDKVDLIVTSDHGMTTIDGTNKVIWLDDYVNSTLLQDIVIYGSTTHLRPQPGKAQELVNAFRGVKHITVYLKEDIPDHFHYKNHRRVMPVIVFADEGWHVRPSRYNNRLFFLRGDHGYSNDIMTMKPIFMATGPSFKDGEMLKPIKSVDIYPLLCDLLNITPAPNNGSFDRVKDLLKGPGGGSMASATFPSFFSVILSVLFTYLYSTNW